MMMYSPHQFEKLKSMYESRGLEIDETQLPNIGFITDNAACFLIITNCKICFLEFLVSRKGDYGDEVDAVMNACLNQAKEMGYTQVFGLSSVDSAVKRALDNGFKITNQKVILKRGL